MPCKVGDPVWYVDKYSTHVERFNVRAIRITENGIGIQITLHDWVSADEIDKTLFLNREAADNKFLELQAKLKLNTAVATTDGDITKVC